MRDETKIPESVEKIETLYAAAPSELRSSVTCMLISNSHMCVTSYLPEDDRIVSVRSDPEGAIDLLTDLVGVAREEFGSLWLKAYKKHLSQMV